MPSSAMILIFIVVGVAPAFALHLSRDTTCACKNWKHVYQSGNLSCGDGPEFFWQVANPSTQPKTYLMYYNDTGKSLFCSRFEESFDFDQCINMNIGRDEGRWCYVDSKCKSLNGGAEVNSQFSWKNCTTSDPSLREYTLEQLYWFARKLGIKLAREDFGGFVKLAYVGSRSGELPIMSSTNMGRKRKHPCDLSWLSDQMKTFHGSLTAPYWFDTNEDADMPIVVFDALSSTVYKLEKQDYHNMTDDCVQSPMTRPGA